MGWAVTLINVTARGISNDGVLLIGADSLTVTGGSYRNSGAAGIEVDGGSLSITGGTAINGNATGVDVNGGSAAISGVDFGAPVASNGTDLYVATGSGTVTLGGNTFAATTDFINNQSANNIDATGDTFGSYNKSVLADDYAIENKIVDGLDYSGLGLVHIQANNIYVSALSQTNNPGAIQRRHSRHWIRPPTRSTLRRPIPSAT